MFLRELDGLVNKIKLIQCVFLIPGVHVFSFIEINKTFF